MFSNSFIAIIAKVESGPYLFNLLMSFLMPHFSLPTSFVVLTYLLETLLLSSKEKGNFLLYFFFSHTNRSFYFSYHATVFPYTDTSIVGVPEAFVVMTSLFPDNQSSIQIFNTDCNGLTLSDNLITFNITGILSLYTPNLVTLENNRNNTAYYGILKNICLYSLFYFYY